MTAQEQKMSVHLPINTSDYKSVNIRGAAIEITQHQHHRRRHISPFYTYTTKPTIKAACKVLVQSDYSHYCRSTLLRITQRQMSAKANELSLWQFVDIFSLLLPRTVK